MSNSDYTLLKWWKHKLAYPSMRHTERPVTHFYVDDKKSYLKTKLSGSLEFLVCLNSVLLFCFWISKIFSRRDQNSIIVIFFSSNLKYLELKHSYPKLPLDTICHIIYAHIHILHSNYISNIFFSGLTQPLLQLIFLSINFLPIPLCSLPCDLSLFSLVSKSTWYASLPVTFKLEKLYFCRVNNQDTRARWNRSSQINIVCVWVELKVLY